MSYLLQNALRPTAKQAGIPNGGLRDQSLRYQIQTLGDDKSGVYMYLQFGHF